jgi:transcriptional regulator with XRE-family HTH domain
MHMEPTSERTIRMSGRDIPILTQDEIRRRYLDDLPERLERFIEVTGWSWRELAAQLGVSEGRVAGWRKGRMPRGGAMHGLIVLAARTPGGMAVLFPEFSSSFAAEAEEEDEQWE